MYMQFTRNNNFTRSSPSFFILDANDAVGSASENALENEIVAIARVANGTLTWTWTEISPSLEAAASRLLRQESDLGTGGAGCHDG